MEEAVVLGCLRVPCAHELTNSHAVNLKFGPSIVRHLVLQDLSTSRANQECFILNKIPVSRGRSICNVRKPGPSPSTGLNWHGSWKILELAVKIAQQLRDIACSSTGSKFGS